MKYEAMAHVRSGGRRIALYAELGGYFSPDGRLNEAVFRDFIRRSVQERSAGQAAGEWLSGYLEQVLGYLEEKGMGPVMLHLFEVAVDESASLGWTRFRSAPSGWGGCSRWRLRTRRGAVFASAPGTARSSASSECGMCGTEES